MEAQKLEYQHFIPQFLLRNFSHKYVPRDKSKAGKSQKHDRKKKMYRGDQAINSLCLSDDEFYLDECSVRRACGLENMYVDPTKPLQDHGHLEKKFAIFENKASCIYRKIIKAYEDGKPAILLKRAEKDVLRKFIFLLAYRGEAYYRKYNLDSMQDYDDIDKELLQNYMTTHGLTKPIEVWFQSLEMIIDLDIDPEGCWKQHVSESIYFPIAEQFISHIYDMYMAICTPANDEEFILTDNCYNVSEGRTVAYFDNSTGKQVNMGPRFHEFAPISPKLIIVLRSAYLPEPLEDADPAIKVWRQFQRHQWIDSIFGSGTESILEDLPIRKAINDYMEVVNGRLAPKSGWSRRLSINDSFCFTIFKIPTRHVRTINGLLIDHAFHSSRIIFNRKDIFLDLMEWYLTEPCEVGKNLTGENAFQRLKYIEGLSNFMLREEREISPKLNFWPSGIRDLKQLRLQNIAGPQFLEGARLGKDGIGFGFDAIYKKLGGTMATSTEDMAMSKTMLKIWIRCVDLDWSSPEYESLCRNKLACLLDGYQRQSCSRFWMFLKRMRLAKKWGLESIQVIEPFFEQACLGSEDMLAYAYPLIQGHELNVAMYESFNKSVTRMKGTGCGLESMGFFSLFGDERWRIPTPLSHRNQPCENDQVTNVPDVKKIVRSSLFERKNRKASAQSPHRNWWLNHYAKEKVAVSKATNSSIFDTQNRKISTGPIEQSKPCDDDEAKDEAGIKKTAHQFHNEGWKPQADAVDPKEKVYVLRDPVFSMILMFYICTAFIISAILTFSLLGTLSYLLAFLFHFLVWLLDSLTLLLDNLIWLLDILSSAFYNVARFLCYLGLVLVSICMGISNSR
ncbi:hypothetical protein ACQKWADRAFT_138928 [Trichoderma austrokoningii]